MILTAFGLISGIHRTMNPGQPEKRGRIYFSLKMSLILWLFVALRGKILFEILKTLNELKIKEITGI
jgi:hypothetical protein